MSKEIVPAGSFAALTPAEDGMALQDIVSINMGSAGIDPSMLDKVKVPSGGSLTWEVPSLDGEDQPTKDLIGVIVGQRDIRSYFATEYDGSNNPPECASNDGVTGVPLSDSAEGYGGACDECPMSKWGSGKEGRGQACSQRKLLLMLQPDSMLPIVVNVPPTSVNEVNRYFLRLTTKKAPHFQVVTNLKLAKAKSGGGIEYAKIAPGFVRLLDKDEAESAKAMYQSLNSVFARVALDEAESF